MIDKVTEVGVDKVIDRWFDGGNDGDWVGVFENHDMSHPELGRRFAAFYDKGQWGKAEIMRTTGPDSAIGLGWRYLLVAKCLTPAEAKAEMEDGAALRGSKERLNSRGDS